MQTSPHSSEKQERSTPRTAAELLALKWPPLARYWPNLHQVSPPQAGFLVLDQLEALYGGAAGGGKSDALLAAALQYVDIPGYAALILRRTFKQLSLPGAIMSRSKEWLTPYRRTGEIHWNDDDKTWTFPSGATVTFGYLESADDIYRYQGPEFTFVAFDELTQFAESQYLYLFSRLRRRVDITAPVRVRAASNPGGVGHAWVLKRFPIKHPPAGDGRLFIPARVDDNPGLDRDEYARSLENLHPALRDQLLDGDWGAFEGAAFTLTDLHLIDSFQPADAFTRFEAADYGLNGAPWCSWLVDFDGNLIANDLLYVRQQLPSAVAAQVLAARHSWGEPEAAYMDPSVWRRTGTVNRWGEPAMLSDEFTDYGVTITRANNDPRAGLIRLRELLEPDPNRRFPAWHPRAGEPGAPRIFFHRERCAQMVEELQAAPLQPIEKRDGGEIVKPDWESQHGHSVAMARYAVMSRPAPSREPEEPLPDPRAERLRRIERDREAARPRYQWT